MALAIDTKRVAKQMSQLQESLNTNERGGRRYQVQRICVYATVHVGRSSRNYVDRPAKQEALDWQADPDDIQDDPEVFHHLQQQAATVPMLSEVVSGSDSMKPATTTLVASVHSSSFAAMTRGRLLPSFHRCSIRGAAAITCLKTGNVGTFAGTCDTRNLPPRFHKLFLWRRFGEFSYIGTTSPVVGAMNTKFPHFVFVHWQADVVDLLSRRSPPTCRPAKRQRAAVNLFLQLSDPPVVGAKSRGDRLPHDKRFNGVRYRLQQDRWEAMMKPPKFRNKKYFGSFKVEAQAALAVDAAFHHYGRPHLLNFRHSSLQLLATRPAAGAELDESAKLRFVQGEAKWLASVATDLPPPALPSSSLSVLNSQPSASSSVCPSPQFRSLTEILCSVGGDGGDEGDYAVSQPRHLDPLSHIFPPGMQSEQPISGGLSSVQITEQITEQEQEWGGEEGYILAALPMVGDSSACEMQSSWLDSLLRSSPASMYPLPSSPRHFDEEMALAWLERQSCRG